MTLPDDLESENPITRPGTRRRTMALLVRPGVRIRALLVLSLVVNLVLLLRGPGSDSGSGSDGSSGARQAALDLDRCEQQLRQVAITRGTAGGDHQSAPIPPTPDSATQTTSGYTGSGSNASSGSVGSLPPGTPSTPATTAATATADRSSSIAVLRLPLDSSIARTFSRTEIANADAISAEYARIFMWDLDLRRDLRPSDELALAYDVLPGGDPEIPAASLRSERHGRTFWAFRYRAAGDSFDSYWNEEGFEVPRRLVNSPLDEYEEITSLLGDRAGHAGLDIKAPEGTPVHSPWDGRVTRINWNQRANGRCIEVDYGGNLVAKYLHLSEVQVEAGQQIHSGEVIALSGNTGHSTAPHLHYQLNRGERVLDPLEVHGTTRRQIPADEMADFNAAIEEQRALLDGFPGTDGLALR